MSAGQSPRPGSHSELREEEEDKKSIDDGAGSVYNRPETTAGDPETTKEPSKMKKLWIKIGLDRQTVMMMAKAAISPTIAISIYQADSVANEFTTLGYLVAIASLLTVPIMPRAKFLQTLVLNVIAACLGAAVATLAIWTAVQARKHTTPPGGSLAAYNSSASAVCGIWLFFEIYIINILKSARPQFIFPTLLASIFAVVSMSYAANFADMQVGLAFVKKLLSAFLTGFAISTGVSLFVFPVSSRTVVFKEMTGYLGSLRGMLKIQNEYIDGVQTHNMFRDANPEALKLKAAAIGIKALHGKLAQDLTFAKRDFAWGKLLPSDISEIVRLLREILLPIVGMASLVDIFKRIADMQGWNNDPSSEANDSSTPVDPRESQAVLEWQIAMKTLHGPFVELSNAMDEALEHIALTLEFKKAPKKGKSGSDVQPPLDDVEAKGSSVRPGDPGFSAYFEEKSNAFYKGREVSLRDWCQQKGIKVPPNSFEAHVHWPIELEKRNTEDREYDQRQLFVLLYMELLLWSASRAVLELVRFADGKVAEGTMKKNRLIFPGRKRLRKWITSTFTSCETSNEDHYEPSDDFGGSNKPKDPEHLPPQNTWQVFGNGVRSIPHALRSGHSAFGFRVACAVMTIEIVAYLRASAKFFVVQRLFWAAIMASLSMTRLAGQSTFGFVLRIVGTFVAMVASFVVWYIVDGHPAGVLVFEFFWIFCCMYILVKLPRYVMVGMISAITSILIIGYELQVKKIGVVVATSNLQAYYPIYELAPYRLACVAGGLAVAFFWTIFPYPISEHSEIRRDLGWNVRLLAKHHEIVRVTIATRMRGNGGDLSVKTSPIYRLTKARLDVFAKHSQLMERLRMNSGFHAWGLSLGGKFPLATYDACIRSCDMMLNYGSLLSYGSKFFAPENESQHQWQIDLLDLIVSIQHNSHELTARLCLLSASISNGIPLPPHLEEIEPFSLVHKLQALDNDILGMSHIAEPGYAAFAVMQIAVRSFILELNTLTKNVKELVGELEFSIQGASTSSSPMTSSDKLTNKPRKAE